MTSSIEMEDLAQKRSAQLENEKSVKNIPQQDGAVTYWSFACAAALFLLSSCLALFPRVLLFLSESSDERRAALTPLESFLSRHFGIWLAAVALATILNTPSPSSPAFPRHAASNTQPLIGSITLASTLSAFLAYNGTQVGSLSTLVLVLSGTIGLWGIWAIVFEGTASVSKKTGADKHTSSFLFGNKSAASKQKKEWKKQHA